MLAGAAPVLAAPATTSATWAFGCTVAVATAEKDISNIVYRLDGVDTKIEFRDGTRIFSLPGASTDIWVKSGNNASGDGPGYGEHFQRPSCDSETSTVTVPVYDTPNTRVS